MDFDLRVRASGFDVAGVWRRGFCGGGDGLEDGGGFGVCGFVSEGCAGAGVWIETRGYQRDIDESVRWIR